MGGPTNYVISLTACARGRFHHRLAVRSAILLLLAGVYAQLSFRNSFQLNEWSDLYEFRAVRAGAPRNRYSAGRT